MGSGMKTLISIDPGQSSGIAIGTYSDTEPFKLTHAFQIEGGLLGLLDRVYFLTDGDYGEGDFCGLQVNPAGWNGLSPVLYSTPQGEEVVTICEKFTPRQALSLAAAEPLRIEGYLVGTGVIPDYVQGKKNPLWMQPAEQYFTGGKDLAEKKKRARLWRIEHGLHLTGKMVGCADADDANSAIQHAVAWLRKNRHAATLDHYFKE